MQVESVRNTYVTSYLIFYFLLSIAFASTLIEPVLLPRQLVLSLFCLFLIYMYARDTTLSWNFFVSHGNRTFLITGLILMISFCFATVSSFNTSLGVYVSSKYCIELLFLTFTAHLLILGKITIKHVSIGVLIFIVVQIVSGLFQSLGMLEEGLNLVDNKEISGLTANKNLFASCLFLSLPFLVYLAVFSSPVVTKIVSILGVLSALWFIYILQSKTVYVGLFVSIFSFGFLALLFNKKWSFKRKFWISSIVVIFVFLVASIFYLQKKTYFDQYLHQNTELLTSKDFKKHNENTTLLVRFTLWKNSFHMIKESPLLGKGPGNWILFFPKFGLHQMKDPGVENGTVVFQNPHNDWILLLSELGLIGFVCYLFFYVFGVYLCIKNIRNQHDKSVRFLNLLILSTWIGLFLIHSGDFPLERIEHQVLIYSMYAIVLYSYSLQLKKQTITTTRFGIGLGFFFLVTALFSTLVSYNRWQSEKKIKLVKEAMLANQWNVVIENTKDLESIFYTIDPTTIPISWYTGVAFFNLNQFQTAIPFFEKAYRTNPYNVNVLSNYAACYTKLNAFQKATVLYKKALLISPRFDELRLNLCVVYYKQRKYKEAFNCLLNCTYQRNSANVRFKTYIPEVTKAFLGNRQMSTSNAEKYFYSQKNN